MNLKQAHTLLCIGAIVFSILGISGYATNQPSLTWFLALGFVCLVSAIAVKVARTRKR